MGGGTFYIEYERRLYRWTLGHRKWHDLGMQDSLLYSLTFTLPTVFSLLFQEKLSTSEKATAFSSDRWMVGTHGEMLPQIFPFSLIERSHRINS